MCMCVCLCVCVCGCACVRACMHACMRVRGEPVITAARVDCFLVIRLFLLQVPLQTFPLSLFFVICRHTYNSCLFLLHPSTTTCPASLPHQAGGVATSYRWRGRNATTNRELNPKVPTCKGHAHNVHTYCTFVFFLLLFPSWDQMVFSFQYGGHQLRVFSCSDTVWLACAFVIIVRYPQLIKMSGCNALTVVCMCVCTYICRPTSADPHFWSG